MASYKVNWILVVSALVGCVLSVPAASPSEADAILIARLTDKKSPLKPEQLKEILQNHKDQNLELCGYKVKVWVDLCKPSLSKCTLNGFSSIEKLETVFGGIVESLRNYAEFCRNKELRNFCAENFEQIRESLLRGMKSEEKEVARSYLKILHNIWPHNRTPGDEQIIRAHKELVESDPKFAKIERRVFSKFDSIYLIAYHKIKNLPSEYEPIRHKSKLSAFLRALPSGQKSKAHELSPEPSSSEDILITEWWKLCAASNRIEAIRFRDTYAEISSLAGESLRAAPLQMSILAPLLLFNS